MKCFSFCCKRQDEPVQDQVEKSPRALKKCLMIGINYTGTSSELNGCINDSNNLKKFLVDHRYMTGSDIVMMNDHSRGELYPTKDNIMAQLEKLVQYANAHKTSKIEMFVSYSGHGYYLRDYEGDEQDHYDEVLCPIDCDTEGYLRDDVIYENFIVRLPSNVRLVMMIDACHSGSSLDLNYVYKYDKMSEGNENMKCVCDVVMVSGSTDSTTSADAYLPGGNLRYQYQGAMTASFLATYKDGISYKKLIDGMRKWLKKRDFEQVPQLSTGKMVDINNEFLLGVYD